MAPDPSPVRFDEESGALTPESWRVLAERLRRGPARIPALTTIRGENWPCKFPVED